MSEVIPPGDPKAMLPSPSPRALGAATGAALLTATVILATMILPAEYGIDPLGTGRVLGIAALAQPAALVQPVPPPQGAELAPIGDGNPAWYPGEYKVDSRAFVLGPVRGRSNTEYHLAKDAVMLFSWTASGNVIQDFHGDRDNASGSPTLSFDKQPRQKADGMFTAPFAGIHGWDWENPGGQSVTVKVTTAGFYSSAHEFHFDRTRESHQVQDLTAIPISGR